jgi:hypothetical protein
MTGSGTLSSLSGTATLQTAGGGGGAFNCADLLDCPSFTDLQTEIAAASLAISGLETSVENLEISVGNLETEVAGKFDIPTGTASDYLDGAGTVTPFPTFTRANAVFREVRNETGATLTKGTVVYISGASGNKATVSKAIANTDATSAQTFGLIFENLSNNQNGTAIVFGELTGLNTSAFAAGVQLYLSPTTAGTFTSTKQYAPNHLVYIGVVTRSHANQGSIEIKIQNGYELDELHDVEAQTPANRNSLFYDSTSGTWKARAMASEDVPTLDAAKIGSGTFDTARIPTLDASKVGTGTFADARIPSIDAAKTTSGTFNASRIPKIIRPSVRFTTATLSGTGTTNEQVIQTITIPANTLNVGDIIRLGVYYSFSGNGGTKAPRVRLGNNTIIGSALYQPSALGATVNSCQAEVLAIVTSSTNLRTAASSTVSGFGSGTGALTNNTIDLTAAIDFSINIQKATAGDTAILEFFFIEILTS